MGRSSRSRHWRAPGNAVARRRTARRAAQERRRTTRRQTLDPDRLADRVLVGVAVLAVVSVGVGWWADAVRSGGARLGIAVGRQSPLVLEVDVPDGALAVVALALMVVPVLLAVAGRVATHRETTGGVSRLSAAAAVVAVVVAPSVSLAFVAAVHGGGVSGWRVAAYVWPVIAGCAASFVVTEVAERVRPRQGWSRPRWSRG